MASEFTDPTHWENEGIEPSETLQSIGFQGGYKPPAGVFNYLFHNNEKCIKELQNAVNNVEKGKSDNTHTHNYAGSSSAGGAANNALKSNRITSIVKQADTSGTSNKYAKLAAIAFSQIYVGKTYRLFIADAANGNNNADVCIQARAGSESGSYIQEPSIRVNSFKNSIDNYFLMYDGWSIELWVKCPVTDICAMEVFEICSDDTASVSITYEKPLTWLTDAPTAGTKVNAIIGFNNYLPLSGGTISNAEYAGALKINRISSSGDTALSAIDYLLNGNRIGVMGFDSDSMMRVRNSQNSEMMSVTVDGALKTASSGKLLYSSSTSSASPVTISIADLFTKYSAALCNVTTSSDKYSLVLPLQYIKSLGTSSFYEAEDLLFYYVNDNSMTIRTGLGQSNPTINSVKIINLL